MMINEYFQEPDSRFTHPRLRRWQTLLGRPGVKGSVEVHRPLGALGFEPATLYVTFTGRETDVQESESWNDELNIGLVAMGVAARTPEDEARRYALALAGAFESIEADVGEGFFSAVLVEQLRGGPFAGRLAPILDEIHTPPASRDSRRLAECDDQIRRVISSHARELTTLLDHGQPEAERILADALEQYLDDRFHITSRRLLGFTASR